MLLDDPLEALASRIGLPDPLPAEPFALLAAWREAARVAAQTPNPDAMVLATSTTDGQPSARVVLCKAIRASDGSLEFFTNYSSAKARDLDANPRAASVFHWDHVGRQARVVGSVARVSTEESDAYFATRPLLSRLGAWASEQGRPLERRLDMIRRVRDVMRRFGVGPHHLALPSMAPSVPRPPSWGGYRLHAESVELWVGGAGRLHDRARWRRSAISGDVPGASEPGHWMATRLQP